MTALPFELHGPPVTGSSGVELPALPDQTMASITRQFGILRDETSTLDADVVGRHRAAQRLSLELRAREWARRDVPRLLRELSSQRGLGWSDIARLVGVSVQALRKWRSGDPATGEHRLAVARLAAFLDLLEDKLIDDPAGWLEMPLVAGYSPRYLDLYQAGRIDLLFELAGLRTTPEQALDEFAPDWRQQLRLEHEVFEAGDGHLSIRRRR
jgi:transcriptional regulator with XRE-family HTH domain